MIRDSPKQKYTTSKNGKIHDCADRVNRWDEMDETHRSQVEYLIDQGRFEFVNGGWVSHDTACTTYNMIIDNMY